MKQIILNVSEGVKKINIQTREPCTESYVQLVLDEIVGDPVILDVDCSGKIELRKITPADFVYQMNEIAREYGHDEEVAHRRMDDLICRVLREQGFASGVQVFNRQSKYYG